MSEPGYYAAKIAECIRLLESNDDPLSRDVYRAMAAEFAEKQAGAVRPAQDRLATNVDRAA